MYISNLGLLDITRGKFGCSVSRLIVWSDRFRYVVRWHAYINAKWYVTFWLYIGEGAIKTYKISYTNNIQNMIQKNESNCVNLKCLWLAKQKLENKIYSY